MAAPRVPSSDDLLHEVARLRAELGEARTAMTMVAEELGRDTEAAERASSRFWFAAWRNSQSTNQRLREEIARLKEPGRG
jgi:hypothetical protein